MSDIDIRHLTALAQLKLSDEEADAVTGDLARIIDMVDQMQAMDTEGVQPLAHPLDTAARLRPDQVTEQVDRDLYQRGAPETENGLYLVPRVVE
jgi:aspartyl-tRNA(Asn)/glutamyl-tRNA(Gln) amidotransferase subunit C